MLEKSQVPCCWTVKSKLWTYNWDRGDKEWKQNFGDKTSWNTATWNSDNEI